MQLNVSDDEAVALRNLLHDWLPELRREYSRTDLPSRELRHELKKRIDAAERLSAQLEQSIGATTH